MAAFIRLKLLEEPQTATIQEVCTEARQKIILREVCPVDDWSRYSFNEMSSDSPDKLMTMLTKMTEKPNWLENRSDALTQKLDILQQSSSAVNRSTSKNSQNWRGSFRGRSKNNPKRGNRGFQNNHGQITSKNSPRIAKFITNRTKVEVDKVLLITEEI